MNRIQILNIFVVVSMLTQLSCEEVPKKFETKYNRVNIATWLYENEDQYSNFIQIMEASDLTDALSSYNPNGDRYTLFLPSNEAFKKFFEESEDFNNMQDLLANIEFTNALSRYHVVNRRIATNDFPLGALQDTTIGGNILTIAYIQGEDSTYFKINNRAFVEKEDLEMANGVIHVLDNVLIPIVYSGFEWLKENKDYSLFTEILELTGLDDTLGIFITDEQGRIKNNWYTLLVEADSIFNKHELYSIDDLKQVFSPDRTDYTQTDNDLYQFAAYHILEGSYFLADLDDSRNYNTYAFLPVQISASVEIRVNTGVEVFDSIFNERDSIYKYIDYIQIKVNESNVAVKNGPIHFVDQVMELFRPPRTRRTFQFYEEPVIFDIRLEANRYIFNRVEEFTILSWSGTDELIWEKRSSSQESANNQDYLEIEGDFSISYEIPKILPGQYGCQIRANYEGDKNATIQVFLDGKQIGGNLNLTTGGASGANPYRLKNLGVVEFPIYDKHTVTIRSLIPGKFIWDFIRFESSMRTYDENNQ